MIKTDNIIVSVMNREKHKDIVNTVPHRNILDLSVIYRSINETSDEGICSIIVNNNLLNKMELNEEELFQLAMKNTEKLLPFCIEKIDSHFYVLTNPKRIFGAAGAFITNKLETLSNEYRRNLYILPSSVHEVFVLPDFGQDSDYLKSVVEDANMTVVKPKDVLSDSVYYFNYQTKTMEVIK